jgi:flagellar hook-associated protein 2
LAVTSAITATSDMALKATVTAGSSTVTSTATLTAVKNATDTLSGSITMEAGSGSTMEFDISSLTDKTLAGLSSAINSAGIGITASVESTSSGSQLLLTSETAGSAGTLVVSSSLLDTANISATTLKYTNSSDINSLTSLGISVNNDGSLTLDAASLASVLNSDYSGVVGFFQNANSWGLDFSKMLTSSGISSTTGILALSSSSNSNIESSLNANISKEEILISKEQASLTAELNSANEIMQELPTQLDGVNELYSAITGYNQSSN